MCRALTTIPGLGFKIPLLLVLTAWTSLAQIGPAAATNLTAAPTIKTNPVAAHENTERIRTACIRGRRTICGKILQVLPEGLVIESGYSSLLRPPLTQSWLVPSTVSASRDGNTLEGTDPGAVCQGLIFLTDLPKSPKPKPFDFVIIQGYPAGDYNYVSVPPVTRTIRKFAAGLETAVRLSLARSD